MNTRNQYETLLEIANNDLIGLGKRIVIEEEEGDYSVKIVDSDNNTEIFAEGWDEEDLEELINEAWDSAKQTNQDPRADEISEAIKKLPDEMKTKLISEVYFNLPDYWKDRFLEMTDNR